MESQAQAMASAVDALHAVAAGQAGWREACIHIAAAVGGDATTLVAWRGSDLSLLDHEGLTLPDSFMAEYRAHYVQHDLMLHMRLPAGQWQVSTERFASPVWKRGPFFGDLLPRYRIGQALGLTLQADGDVVGGLLVQRHGAPVTTSSDFRSGPLATLTTAVMQTFERRYAGVLALRHAVHAMLDDADCSAFLVDRSGVAEPLHPARPLPDSGPIHVRGGRLQAGTAAGRAPLQHAMQEVFSGRRASFALHAHDGCVLRVEMRLMPRQAQLLANRPLALVTLRRRGPHSVPAVGELQAVFGLTPAQARVLRLLCEGLSVQECADTLGTSVATVRTQVAQLLARMDCKRQAQAVSKAMLAAR